MRAPSLPLPRGSTLLLAVVLLAVLSIIGVAAVSLGSQERQNASAKGKRDALFACAAAARVKIWAELAKYGRGYLDSTNAPQQIQLADGTQLAAPAHYSPADEGVTVKDLVVKHSVKMAGATAAVDLTNRMESLQILSEANAYQIVARCSVPGTGGASPRELEIEFVLSLAL